MFDVKASPPSQIDNPAHSAVEQEQHLSSPRSEQLVTKSETVACQPKYDEKTATLSLPHEELYKKCEGALGKVKEIDAQAVILDATLAAVKNKPQVYLATLTNLANHYSQIIKKSLNIKAVLTKLSIELTTPATMVLKSSVNELLVECSETIDIAAANFLSTHLDIFEKKCKLVLAENAEGLKLKRSELAKISITATPGVAISIIDDITKILTTQKLQLQHLIKEFQIRIEGNKKISAKHGIKADETFAEAEKVLNIYKNQLSQLTKALVQLYNKKCGLAEKSLPRNDNSTWKKTSENRKNVHFGLEEKENDLLKKTNIDPKKERTILNQANTPIHQVPNYS